MRGFAASMVAVLTALLVDTAARAASIVVESTSGGVGERVTFSVVLHSGGAPVIGLQNDLSFDAMNTPVAARTDGRPECVVDPSIDKAGTAFGFLPARCSGTACTGIRAVVLSFANPDAIPDGAVLYRCTVDVATDAVPQDFPIVVSGVRLSGPGGQPILPWESVDGWVRVRATAATPTPTTTATATPTATLTVTPRRCAGDCDGDGVVTVDEVVMAVSTALGLAPLSACQAVDGDGNGSVTIDDLLRAMRLALDGCSTQ